MVYTPIEAFLSHASEERRVAGLYRKRLKEWGINVFLAHEDIEGGEEWMRMLYEKIQNCDVFLILLSRKYHKAHYTDQETGIAYALNIPIIPISLNGTKPYGFISKFQSSQGSKRPTNDEAFIISDRVLNHPTASKRIMKRLIHSLQAAESYEEANTIAKWLFYYKKFSNKQVNEVAKALIENTQVSGGFVASRLAIKMLRENLDKISPQLRRKLRTYLV